jgi:methylenetetrahydrofolate reductase (NADPH)
MAASPESMNAGARSLRPRLARSSRRQSAGPDTVAMHALIADATIELIPMKSLDDAVRVLRPATKISVTCSPAKSIEATLDETERLVALGHTVTPHISARMVQSDDHLRQITDRIEEIGVTDIFVVAGDADPPGIFFDTIEFLEAFLALDPAVGHIGYTSYPDAHPLIDTDKLHAALHRKQELILDSSRTAHVTTQMCFSTDRIRTWLSGERASGLTVPVHLGLPGVIDRTKLMTMGMRLGVGTSLRYLSKNRKSLSRLMTQRAFQPDQLLRPLTGDIRALGIDGLHLFSFNQVAPTEEWRDRTLRR